MKNIKITNMEHPIIDAISQRWSSRAFSDEQITEDQLLSLLEAARWAASSNNEQPWLYWYAFNGSDAFQQIWNCLMPGNQPWTVKASVLLVCGARKKFQNSQRDNYYSLHDLGMANANLLIQATAMGISGRVMAGVDKSKLSESLQLTEDQVPACVIALGFPAAADTLEEPFKERELAPRSRKPVSEFATRL
jgi:nitroreductase